VTSLPGVDVAALERWLDGACPGLRSGPLSGEVIAGGKSNLTYRITDGTRAWALRRPPLAHLLPTAHDMAREYRVLSALQPTDVPVAAPLALCQDAAVIGAPFYLMRFVDGVVLDRPELLDRVDRAAARRCCELLVDTLLALHALRPAEVGLADFGRPDGFLARQVRRWHAQWQASQTAPREEVGRLAERFAAALPAQGVPAIVHGDYRLTNVIFSPDVSRIAAVVDWEMATTGDPLTDVGLLVVYQTLAAEGDVVLPHLTPEGGFLSPGELVERYRACSGRDLSRLPWYVGFGYFKLAVVAEGIHSRFLQGATVGEGFASFGPAVPRLLQAAGAWLDEE
jgi:aminoglycoside phosphotransferase (APT) family kinase protein